MSNPPAVDFKQFNGVTISRRFSSSVIFNAARLCHGWVTRIPDEVSIKVKYLIETFLILSLESRFAEVQISDNWTEMHLWANYTAERGFKANQ